MCTHALAPINFRYVQSAGSLGCRFVPHLLERPDEVHRRRAGVGEESIGRIEVFAALGRQRIAVCRGHADRRRAAHGKRPDRLGDLGCRLAAELELLVRKPALVEQDDRAGFQTNDPFRS